MLAAARLAVPVVFHQRRTGSFTGRARRGRERGPAGAGSALSPPARPVPSRPSRRPGPVTSPGLSGTYVTPLLFLPLPEKTNSFPRPPNSLSAPGQASARPAASFLPRRLRAGGTQLCPSPAAGQRSQRRLPPGAPSPSQSRFPTWPRESGRSPGGEGLRQQSFPLAPRPALSRTDPQPAHNAAGRRCSPGTARSGRRSPHGRGHTPRAGGRTPGHRPAGRGGAGTAVPREPPSAGREDRTGQGRPRRSRPATGPSWKADTAGTRPASWVFFF